MKIFLKIFLSGTAFSFVLAVIGGIAGAFLSGVMTFPEIGYARGYESGAMIVGTISTVIGGTLGSWFALPRLYKANTFLVPTGIVVILALVLVCGYAIIEKSFDGIPRWYLDGINLVILVTMPLIIARRATLAS